jgi:hypothetical protein
MNSPPEPKDNLEQPQYSEKTNRIEAISQLIKAITPLIWAIVVLVVIVPLLGKIWLGTPSNEPLKTKVSAQNNLEIPVKIPKKSNSEIDREVSQALQTARANSQTFALGEIDGWVGELMTRVDNSFLPWYFNYFNQKQFEGKAFVSGLYSTIAHWVNNDNPPPAQVVAENLTKTIQTEFTKRVIRPQEAQLRLERITRDAVNLYLNNLSSELDNIQASYQIPQGQWERYLSDVAVTIRDTEGNISNTSIKVLIGGTTALGVKSLIPAIKVGSTVYLSLAGKTGAKIATKTGGAVASSFGAELIDPIVGIGLIVWDLWDYQHTVNIEKPILRDAIFNYLEEVKYDLVDNHQGSVLSSIYQIEASVNKSLMGT